MPGQRQAPQPKAKTAQYRAWKGGMNTTDSRTDIEDTEAAWLESIMPIGKGALQIVPGVGDVVGLTNLVGVSVFGFTLNGNPVMIIVGSDGSLTQATPGAVVTTIAPAGTVTVRAHVSIWQSSPILIVDPTKGYFSWDGTTFTTIDASAVGEGIAVFEGRVWISHNRTIRYTAPNTYNDLTAPNGAGSTILTDEAFQGNIIALYSSQEQLWIVGNSAIEALSNVQAAGTAPNVVTTFSITNIVANIGTTSSLSVIGYFRALAFLSPVGVYALSGVTPQKLSGKMDGLFKDLTFTAETPAAVVSVNGLLVLCFLVKYNGPNANPYWTTAGFTLPLDMLLCFFEGKWFVHVVGQPQETLGCVGITTVVVDGVSQLWTLNRSGSSNSLLQRRFADETNKVQYLMRGKLYDFGAATSLKRLLKVGFEFQADAEVTPKLSIDSEGGSVTVDLTTSNVLTLINNVGGVLQLTNSLGQPLTLVGQGLVVSRVSKDFSGRYLGFTIAGASNTADDVAYRIQAVQMQYVPSKEWAA